MNHFDVLIIGAGAAGLAAARQLHDAGRRILVLEARNRIGGRIWTDTTFAGFPVELGAEFIHGERAVTHGLVAAAGLTTLPVPRYPQLRWGDGGLARPLTQLPSHLRQTIEMLFRHYRALPTVLPTGADCSLAEYLHRQGCDPSVLDIADVLLAQTCCASLKTLSCADLVREMRADHAGADEARIAESYRMLLEWWSQGLPIRLNTPVQMIRRGDASVTVFTGKTEFHARCCLITVPVSLLQVGAIRFEPPLSAAKQEAIHALRMEPATKLLYRFHKPLWDEQLVYMAHTGVAARWWTPGYGRPYAGVVCAFVTAERARQIDAMDEAAALALGLQELNALLGIHDAASLCVAARRVSWAAEPYTRGGYAHVPTGAAEARIVLAQPEGDALFFAGEATAYDSNPQTVHGAIESGRRAAQECDA